MPLRQQVWLGDLLADKGINMETQIFYWTGAIIWWLIMISTCVTIFTLCVIAPIVAYRTYIRNFNKWKWAAVLATTGLTTGDVSFIMTGIKTPRDIPLNEILEWVDSIKRKRDTWKHLGS